MRDLLTIENLVSFLKEYSSHAYLLLFIGSFFETLIGTGFFLYGEMIFIPGALLAGAGILNIWLVVIVTIGGGILGDNASYFLGYHYGEKLFSKKGRVLNYDNYNKGQSFFRKYGLKGIFLARFMGPLSWITPFLSGVYKIPYSKFIFYNTPGVIFGIGQFLIIGYFFGNNYQKILKITGDYFFYLIIMLLLSAMIYWIIKRNITK